MKTPLVALFGLAAVAGLGLVGKGLWARHVEAGRERERVSLAAGELKDELERRQHVEAEQASLLEARAREAAGLRQRLADLTSSLTNPALLKKLALADSGRPQDRSPETTETAASASLAPAWLSAATDAYVENQIRRAQERLNLNAEQQQSLKKLVNEALEAGRVNLQKALSGKASFDELPTQLEWAKALEQQVLSVLTPEQKASYQTFKQEDIAANARLLAYGELLSLQNNLGLSQEQQDRMFGVLYQHAVGQLDPDPDAIAAQPRHPVAAAEWAGTRKLQSLEAVLTPAQLEIYRRLQESQFQLLQNGLSQLGVQAAPSP